MSPVVFSKFTPSLVDIDFYITYFDIIKMRIAYTGFVFVGYFHGLKILNIYNFVSLTMYCSVSLKLTNRHVYLKI